MDALDMAILRELARDRVLFWGGMDPRLSTGQIARRVGVDRTTVRARLHAWKDEGFLRGQRVYPSPLLLGYRFAAGGVRVADPAMKPAVLAALREVEGILTLVEYVGNWIGVGQAFDSPAALERRLRLLAKLPGVADVQKPFFPPTLEPTVDLTPLDWRLMDALARLGVEPFSRVASEVGISTRTLTRRYERLVRGNALWHVPSLDFTVARAGVMAKLIVIAKENANERAIGAALSKQVPLAHVIQGRFESGGAFFEALGPFATVGAVEQAQQDAAAQPGVDEVEYLFPVRFQAGGEWLRERIAQRASEAAPTRASR